jgi:hypothetical protein
MRLRGHDDAISLKIIKIFSVLIVFDPDISNIKKPCQGENLIF